MRAMFTDRREAGRALAAALAPYRGRPGLRVLALPRGGVPVAAEVAGALGAGLDVLVVRKVGHPLQPEVAIGAIASGGVRVRNEDVIADTGVDEATFEALAAREQTELERRERAYRGDRPPPAVAGRTVIVVDDGIATGATLRAALAALRGRGAATLVVAAPVAPAGMEARLADLADEVVVLRAPRDFQSVGAYYRDFGQVGDDEVRALLARDPSARADRARQPD